MNLKKFFCLTMFLFGALILAPLQAQATAYTWDGGDSDDNWNKPNNWEHNSGYPSTYSDTATIDYYIGTPYIDSTITVGAVTIGTHAIRLNINSGGTLGMQGNLSNARTIYISGTLRNDGSSGTHYSIGGAGSIRMTGGTIGSLSGGIWDLNQDVSGYGTISAPVTNSSSIKASGGTLAVTGSITDLGGTIGTWGSTGIFDNQTGSDLTASHIAMAGGTLTSSSGTTYKYISSDLSGNGTIDRPFDNNSGSITPSNGTLKLSAALTNPGTLYVLGAFDNSTGSDITFPAISMTGGTLLSTSATPKGFLTPNLGGYGSIQAALTITDTLAVSGGALKTLYFRPGGSLSFGGTNPVITIASGATLTNETGATLTLSPAAVTLNGGTISGTSSNPFSVSNLSGYGKIAAPLTNTGTIQGKGGALLVSGNVTNTGHIMNTYGTGGDVLHLRSTITGGSVNASSGGEVDLNGATLTAVTLGTGTAKVTGNSTFKDSTSTAANLLIKDGKTLNLDSLTSNTLNNTGTITVGDGTSLTQLYNANVAQVTLNGGSVVLGGNANDQITAVSGGSFLNRGSISGTGTIAAPMTNQGTITDGAITISANMDNQGTINVNDTPGLILSNSTLTNNLLVAMGGGTMAAVGSGNYVNNQNITGYGTISAPGSNTGTITATNATPMTLGANLINQGGILAASGSGSFANQANLNGYGTISAPVTNTGTMTASGAAQTLTVTGAVSGSGNVAVDAGATLALQNDLSAHDFILNGYLNMTSGKTITLSGNFNNTSTTPWQPGDGLNLVMTGSTFEVAGNDYGAVNPGFSDNFNIASLYLQASANLELVDLVNNGNQGGVHGIHEALYIYSLSGLSGAQLDLNNLWVYVMADTGPMALANGVYNGITVTGSPVPLPSTLLLLGTGLVGLLGLRRRFKKG